MYICLEIHSTSQFADATDETYVSLKMKIFEQSK